MSRFFLLALIFGGVLVFLGIQEWRLLSVTKATPQTLTCQQLSDSGPGDNANINLTDFTMPGEHYFVFQETSKGSGNYSCVWVPVVPLKVTFFGGAEPAAMGNFKVLVKSRNVHNDMELGELMRRPSLHGIVVNKIESLGSEEKNILSSNYHGVDFDNVWILEEGREPSTAAKPAGFIVGGVALLGFGAFLALRKFRGA